jgi:hypothetical protein
MLDGRSSEGTVFPGPVSDGHGDRVLGMGAHAAAVSTVAESRLDYVVPPSRVWFSRRVTAGVLPRSARLDANVVMSSPQRSRSCTPAPAPAVRPDARGWLRDRSRQSRVAVDAGEGAGQELVRKEVHVRLGDRAAVTDAADLDRSSVLYGRRGSSREAGTRWVAGRERDLASAIEARDHGWNRIGSAGINGVW